MSTSADRRTAATRAAERRTAAEPRSAASGFTLLEIMVCVAIVGLCILPLLEVREQSMRMAYKSGHMLHALAYGDRILAQRMLDVDKAKDEAGLIEEDPSFGYTLTVEDYDLSTGRVVEEKDDQAGFSTTTGFSTTSAFTTGVPQDAAPGPDDVAAADTQHRVRRVKLTITWPALDGDQREELVLEQFIPPVIDEDKEAAAAAAKPTPSTSGGSK
jgi:prepilin-type N-terminal cleavage/methylation domain-containing protein